MRTEKFDGFDFAASCGKEVGVFKLYKPKKRLLIV